MGVGSTGHPSRHHGWGPTDATPERERRPAATAGGEIVPGVTYAFLTSQPGSSVPVTYDPCRAISVVVNPRTAPPAQSVSSTRRFTRLAPKQAW